MSAVAFALAALVFLSVVGSIAVVRRLQEPERGWYERASARLVLGIPWGTLVVIAFVLSVYLFVQDGITDLSNPVSLPYRAWSYFSPLGMATSSFSHANLGHLTGNMIATLLVAPIAEFVWGHYPDGRDTDDQDETMALATPWWRTPWLRAFVVFPLVVIGIGLATSLFSLGPVIGFSGLVYAFAGFAIVRFPITTLLATTVIQSAAFAIYRALQTPVLVEVAEASPPAPPSWANVAIQGHALGFFIGLVLGIVLLERRGFRPDPCRVWIAVALYAFSKGLWQIYWFGEGNSFLLFQGPGVAIVLVLAVVITLSVGASKQPSVPPRLERLIARSRTSPPSDTGIDRPLEIVRANAPSLDGARSRGRSTGRIDRITAIAGGARDRAVPALSPATRRGSAFAVVLLVLAVLGGVAIPTNLLILSEPTHGEGETIEVEGYTIEYAEGVENQLVSGLGIDAIAEDEGLEASGVIVSSEQRNIWQEAVTTDQLEFAGERTVTVGGPGWRESVHAERVGWTPVGNETVYQVWLSEDGEDEILAFESGGLTGDPVIENRTVTVVSHEGEFVLVVESTDTEESAQTPIPAANESVDAGGLTFERDDGTVTAVTDGTEVVVAHEETYN
ncbi:rhomboid family intramembrane serine protease [Salinadaptatus halalkaliphilus]|uniref:Rhomboid family intramembrane serine protease n=1 Tax=Salinadaptatus halalkaliphilus TaxID=2419781 RepID=A0A4S3TN04_9EURY|nr:rhomboid family intramembrane serine protease [Salinadaptatus halalkaliphilus]THE65010.1 rhomboid family intramembrane serine protease [Salinadaptatus halalkaliphilus]